MTEKRFWSEDYSVGYYTEIIDNDKELKDVPNPKKNLTIEEAVDTLNELHEENTHIKNTIKEAYNNERTQLGKSVLKQLMEAIQ